MLVRLLGSVNATSCTESMAVRPQGMEIRRALVQVNREIANYTEPWLWATSRRRRRAHRTRTPPGDSAGRDYPNGKAREAIQQPIARILVGVEKGIRPRRNRAGFQLSFLLSNSE
jgi:hypothetical protein